MASRLTAVRGLVALFIYTLMQVFVDHADFTADQTLRRSPLTPLLRTQLAAYEHPGGGACTTYTSSPPTSGAGAEREASEQCPQLFDYCVSAVAPVHCDLAGVLSGAQQLGGGFTELVVRILLLL